MQSAAGPGRSHAPATECARQDEASRKSGWHTWPSDAPSTERERQCGASEAPLCDRAALCRRASVFTAMALVGTQLTPRRHCPTETTASRTNLTRPGDGGWNATGAGDTAVGGYLRSPKKHGHVQLRMVLYCGRWQTNCAARPLIGHGRGHDCSRSCSPAPRPAPCSTSCAIPVPSRPQAPRKHGASQRTRSRTAMDPTLTQQRGRCDRDDHVPFRGRRRRRSLTHPHPRWDGSCQTWHG